MPTETRTFAELNAELEERMDYWREAVDIYIHTPDDDAAYRAYCLAEHHEGFAIYYKTACDLLKL